MPTPKKGAHLGGSPTHRKLIFANLATRLIEYRTLATTETKAKILQPYFKKPVTKVKRSDSYAHRIAAKRIASKEAVYMPFDEIISELDPERNGGYTRLIRVDNHEGDGVPFVRIETVLEKVERKAVVEAAEATVAKVAEKAGESAKDGAVRVESTKVKAPETE